MGVALPPGYHSVDNSSASQSKMGLAASGGEDEDAAASAAARKVLYTTVVRYRECLKNHAVSIAGHALDGCGVEGTLDALKCAASNCHINFHRKEAKGEGNIYCSQTQYHHHHHQHQFSPYYRAPPPAGCLHLTPLSPQKRPLALPAASVGGGGIAGGCSREDGDVSIPSSSGGGGGGRRIKEEI